jgi:hypothetical protein
MLFPQQLRREITARQPEQKVHSLQKTGKWCDTNVHFSLTLTNYLSHFQENIQSGKLLQDHSANCYKYIPGRTYSTAEQNSGCVRRHMGSA